MSKNLIFSGICALMMMGGAAQAETRIIMLGTGTPIPTPDRAGSGLAVIHDGEAYIFDVGPGSVRRMIEAWDNGKIEALYPINIDHIFISHMHSDHTLDFPELASTYWWRRGEKLHAIGPVGLQKMSDGYEEMMSVDVNLRLNGKSPIANPELYKVDVTEFTEDGVVFDENGVKVEAFSVPHGDIHPAYGFKITTPDRTIVYSGDTTYSENVLEQARGVDVLIHEVISDEGVAASPPEWQEYHTTTQTTSTKLAEIANEAKPGLLVLTHVATYSAPPDSPLTEIQALYDGKVVLANDLDEF